MKRVKIFDGEMCCPTGLCGELKDLELLRIARAINNLASHGIYVDRFNGEINPSDRKRACERGVGLDEQEKWVYPIILVDDQVVKMGAYPSDQELADYLQVEIDKVERPQGSPFLFQTK